jgi:hypothetical protein
MPRGKGRTLPVQEVTQVQGEVTFNFYADRSWHPFNPQKLTDLGINGNVIWHNSDLNVGALVVRRSAKYAEFAVSKAGIDYVFEAEQAGRIRCGFLVLLEQEGKMVCAVSVGQIITALDGVPPREGSLGPHWWFNQDGTPHSRGTSDDVPF